jgi:hypothetical protein
MRAEYFLNLAGLQDLLGLFAFGTQFAPFGPLLCYLIQTVIALSPKPESPPVAIQKLN